MNLNATLFGQMITFAIFVWFTMKFVWPHIKSAMDERQKKIAEGLTAAERAHHELQLAQHRVTEQLRDAKIKSTQIIDGANHRAAQIIEEAKNKARHEGQHLLTLAQNEIQHESIRVRQELRKEAVNLAIIGAEKILQNRLDKKVHSEMVDQLIAEMQE